MTASPIERPCRQRGFSLLELSLVMVILALLSSGMLASLSSQRASSETQEALRQLDTAREALYGFAMTHGRLPCPATPTQANTASNAGRENCALQHGVLPWAELALPEADPWGRRFTYHAGSQFTAALTNGALTSFTLATTGTANVKDAASASYNIAADLPAVILSHGKSGAGAYQPSGIKLTGASGDEAENADADLTFIAHTSTAQFDDLVVWIIPAILKARMVSVGKLP
jgi:prepilin-type N-terminal cleavage/methylation domain-containing protein